MDKKRKAVIEGNEISELCTFQLGGYEQKVLIEGKSKELPVVVTLHGGPGTPIPLSVGCRGLFPEFTDEFIMVYWDQLGCGINNHKIDERFTIDSFVDMTVDLLREIKGMFPHNKIHIFSTSWGSILSARVLEKSENMVNGVVACGQIIKEVFFNEEVFNALERSALPRKKLELIKKTNIETITPKEMQLISSGIRKYTEGYFNKNGKQAPMGTMVRGLMTSPDYRLKDFKAVMINGYLNNVSLWKEILKLDLSETLKKTEIPYVMIQGDTDIVASTETVKGLVESSNNPRLQYFTVEHTGHLPGMAMMDQVFSVLKEQTGKKKKWWHEKIAYQIYPKSFMDSNGDGIGDLAGITGKLDYLKELGIDIIWLSPVYQSPFVDQGYDISDYYSIAEEFGTMEDFDRLLAEAKKRDISIIMDLVINHCSDRHEWFQKALKEPDGEYGGYFYFEKGKDGNPPSNYRSYFGGSAWEQIPGTDKYYLHMFAKEQPDLNWENPVVRQKLFDMVNWWLEKGIAGFRIDAIINIKKDLSFPDFEPDGPDGLCACTRMVEQAEGIGAFLGELRDKTFAPHDAFTVGEVFNLKEGALEEFVGDNGYFSSMFDFAPHILSMGKKGWYDANDIDFAQWKKAIIDSQLNCQGKAYLANIIENHDEPRGASRYLPVHARNKEGVKMLGTVSLLLRGIPFLYQGQEIGMTNCRMKDISEYDDIDTRNQYQNALNAGLSKEEALEVCFKFSRDNARTPMQWSGEENAGFTKGRPWLKVNDNYREINVEAQQRDEDSVLSYYKKLIALRKSPEWKDVFAYGEFVPEFEESDSVFAYRRVSGEKEALILANFGKDKEVLKLSACVKEILLCNRGRSGSLEDCVELEPSEVLVLWMEA